MKTIGSLVLVFWLAFTSIALADPTGSYAVEGTNPGNGRGYTGTVDVRRTGETYQVVWNVGGVEYIGTALGAAQVKDGFTMGRASKRDSVLAVSYISQNSFGLAFYVRQPDGSWNGIWTFGGSKQIGTENWFPR